VPAARRGCFKPAACRFVSPISMILTPRTEAR
jgi:hypothetical protein